MDPIPPRTKLRIKYLLNYELEELLLYTTLIDAFLAYEFDFQRLLQVSELGGHLTQAIGKLGNAQIGTAVTYLCKCV